MAHTTTITNPCIKELILDTERLGAKSAKLNVISYSTETRWAYKKKYLLAIFGENPVVWRQV